MATIDVLRYQTIERLTSQHSVMAGDALLAMWESLTAQIVLLVGESGFDSLYARSVFLNQARFPWLSAAAPVTQADKRFTNLLARLQAQPQVIAIEANRQLLVTLTDILASLIGEPLTASILDSAWQSEAQTKVGKEEKDAS